MAPGLLVNGREEMDAGAAISDRLVAWAFGPGREQIALLASDPVVRYWLSLRKRPLERLTVLFDEGGGGEVCGTCVKPCCTQDVRWVVQLGHLLAWPLIGVAAAPAIGQHPEHCVYLGPRGCTLEAIARPAICSAFTCGALDEGLGADMLVRLDAERTVLHIVEQAVFSYLGARYALVSGDRYSMLDATAAALDGGDWSLCAVSRDRREVAGKREIGMTRRMKVMPGGRVLVPSEPTVTQARELDAAQWLAAEAERASARLRHTHEILAGEVKVRGDASELVAAVTAAKREVLAALDAFAGAECARCARSGGGPLPSSPAFAAHRRDNVLHALSRGESVRGCMYMRCASSAPLDLGDVVTWRALGRPPVLNADFQRGRCAVLGADGCGVAAEVRAPSCDAFVCSERPDADVTRIEEAAWRHAQLYAVLRAASLSPLEARYGRVLSDAEPL